MIRRGLPLCCILFVAGSCLAQTAPPPADVQAIAERAYTFAYPLVLTEQTRRAGVGAENHFSHLLRFPDNTFRVVVRPNVDTLYSLAYIDVSHQPVVLHLTDTKGRYYLMQFMDAWTETFSVPGKRTTGTNEKWIALVGPGWRGSLPPRMLRIEAPTNMVVLIGRTQTNGPSDYPAVHEIQKGYLLMTLGQYQSNPNVSESATPSEQVGRAAVPPPVEVARMTPIEFFRQFALLLERNPPEPCRMIDVLPRSLITLACLW